MSLVRWNPWKEMEELLDRYNSAVNLPQAGGQELIQQGEWVPKVDISETENEFVIKAEIPDVDKKDVKVSVENGILSIQGERKQEKEEEGKTFHRIERQYGMFSRSFSLPGTVSTENIKANFKDGMLNITLEKVEEAKPKAIEVNIED